VTATALDVSAPRDETERRAAATVRHEVFVVGQGVPAELEADGLDAAADHVVARLDGRVVATGRLFDGTGPGEAKVQRMAVLPDARGRGVGLAVLRALEARARERGAGAVVLSAQLTARGFYERAGYTARGAEFVEAGIRHVAMRRPLPVVRDLRESDSPAIVRLIGGCFAEYPGCVLDLDDLDRWMLAPRSSYDAWRGRMWVVELDGEVVACCGGKPLGGGPGQADTVELKSLYVDAAARRRGIASELVGLVEAQAREWGARRVELWSDTRFLDAHRLYEGLGYRRLPETRELHDPSNTTEYAFEKDLAL
jgi:predicted GNAT family N-acyltransferase/RimJ/RimL family protein N-acetyltransferase